MHSTEVTKSRCRFGSPRYDLKTTHAVHCASYTTFVPVEAGIPARAATLVIFCREKSKKIAIERNSSSTSHWENSKTKITQTFSVAQTQEQDGV